MARNRNNQGPTGFQKTRELQDVDIEGKSRIQREGSQQRGGQQERSGARAERIAKGQRGVDITKAELAAGIVRKRKKATPAGGKHAAFVAKKRARQRVLERFTQRQRQREQQDIAKGTPRKGTFRGGAPISAQLRKGGPLVTLSRGDVERGDTQTAQRIANIRREAFAGRKEHDIQTGRGALERQSQLRGERDDIVAGGLTGPKNLGARDRALGRSTVVSPGLQRDIARMREALTRSGAGVGADFVPGGLTDAPQRAVARTAQPAQPAQAAVAPTPVGAPSPTPIGVPGPIFQGPIVPQIGQQPVSPQQPVAQAPVQPQLPIVPGSLPNLAIQNAVQAAQQFGQGGGPIPFTPGAGAQPQLPSAPQTFAPTQQQAQLTPQNIESFLSIQDPQQQQAAMSQLNPAQMNQLIAEIERRRGVAFGLGANVPLAAPQTFGTEPSQQILPQQPQQPTLSGLQQQLAGLPGQAPAQRPAPPQREQLPFVQPRQLPDATAFLPGPGQLFGEKPLERVDTTIRGAQPDEGGFQTTPEVEARIAQARVAGQKGEAETDAIRAATATAKRQLQETTGEAMSDAAIGEIINRAVGLESFRITRILGSGGESGAKAAARSINEILDTEGLTPQNRARVARAIRGSEMYRDVLDVMEFMVDNPNLAQIRYNMFPAQMQTMFVLLRQIRDAAK